MSRTPLVPLALLAATAGALAAAALAAIRPGHGPPRSPEARTAPRPLPSSFDPHHVVHGNLFAAIPGPGAAPAGPTACPPARVAATWVDHGDSSRSAALLELGTTVLLGRPGSGVDGFVVHRITTAAVELRSSATTCRLSFGPGPDDTPEPPGGRGSGERVVSREMVRAAIEGRSGLPVRLVSAEGGVQLYGIREGGRAWDLGLRNGDRVRRIGGEPVTDLGAMLRLAEGMDRLERVEIVLERAGEPHVLTYVLR